MANANSSSANDSRPGSASSVSLVTAISTTKNLLPVLSPNDNTAATLPSPSKAPTAPSNIPKDSTMRVIHGGANPHLQRGIKRSGSPLDKSGPSKHHRHSDTQSHNSPSAPPKPTSSPENSTSTSPTLAPTSPSTDIAPALTPTAHAPPSTPEALSARGMNVDVDRKSMDITVPPREIITGQDRWNIYHSDYDKAKSLQILSSPDSVFFTPAPSSTPTPIGSSYTLPHSLMRHMPLEHLLQVDENHRSQKMVVGDVLSDSAFDLTRHSGGDGMNNDGRDAGRSALDESTAGNSTKSQSLGISAFFRYPLAHLLGEASA
ncbi:hypothetical protein F5878DRAFT_603152 [Lentinula raphanica]|uniref:Uncharacterized protein n=1 Tax=Lentinula raphanica TaxID=153919 RepID=A0AA38PJZ3_9AGAR|nr:hypothetical protein F5878DRAFT_603152 [Lentinula raphanica]